MSLYIRYACTLLGMFALSACTITPPRGTAVSEEITQTLKESQAQSRNVTERLAVPMPPLNMNTRNQDVKPVEHRFDITVQETPAHSFFMSLVKNTPHNMILPPSLKGKISLSLKNVTIAEVMRSVRDIYGFEYQRTPSGYMVLPRQLQSRIFKIDYLNVQRAGISRVRVSSGQVTAPPSSTAASGTDQGDNTNQAIDAVSGSEVNTRSNTDFWADLHTALTAIIGTKDGRQVIANPQSGIIVVRALPKELRTVDTYLKTTQKIIQRQVILEAKIIEVTLNDGFQSGINWSIIAHNGSQSIVAGQFGGSSLLTTGSSNLRGQNNVLNPGDKAGIRSDMASAFGGLFALGLNFGDFNGFMEFLKTQGNVHVLSSPRVSTINNQKAVIKVGTDEFFVTDINTDSSTVIGATSSNQSVDVQLTPFFSGVALDVIPEISANNDVTLHIHPSVSEVKEKIKEININQNNKLSLPLAQSTIRESDSIVRAHNGQVVVIGGLMQNQIQTDVASVPLLGDLPWIGGLFRHNKQVMRKTELVILLRPVVITGNHDWSTAIAGISTTLGRLQDTNNMIDTRP